MLVICLLVHNERNTDPVIGEWGKKGLVGRIKNNFNDAMVVGDEADFGTWRNCVQMVANDKQCTAFAWSDPCAEARHNVEEFRR